MKKVLLLISSLIVMLTFTACGGSEEKEAAVKDTLIIAQGADAKSLDPHASNDQPSSRVSAQIYNGLVATDMDMNIVPALAESWDQPDPRTTIFHLRKGVKFHNGEEFKASDVKFTIEGMIASATVHHIISAVESVEVMDDYTVKITTKKPFGPLLHHLAHTASSMLNEKAVVAAGDDYGQNPVGTGPYKFVKWNSGDRIVLEANEEYFLGAPKVKNVIFRNITEGTNRTIGLETGEVDIAYDIEPIDKKQVSGNEDLELIEEDSLGIAYIGFNFQKAPFDNKLVRQAIGHAIDVDIIIDVVLDGAGTKANSPIGPKVFGYDKEAKGYDYNPELAKKMLTEAGYPNGFKTTIWTNDNPVRLQIATIMQDQLKQIGIEMAVVPVEWGAYLDGTARGEHDMFILGWVTTTGDADYGLNALFNTATIGGAGNRSFYSNKDVDKWLDLAQSSTNPEERIELYAKIQKQIQEDLPVDTLYYNTQNAGINKRVKGFKLNPAGHHKIYGVYFQ
ncbi:MAG: glutathione ABC transporter substrate-binding protein [Psychrilyobacter sp.]|nr:glutathione ABC transporter substrate-binding protein [Psychrilyobacter sp.]